MVRIKAGAAKNMIISRAWIVVFMSDLVFGCGTLIFGFNW